MDEIEYKLESTNPVLISHAISKLIYSIKKKMDDQTTDHISKVAEFKLLLTKRDSTNMVLSMSACQALIALVEDKLWDIREALATFVSNLSSIKNNVVAATAIGRLLLLDLKHIKENETIYPFTLHIPQHPFIMILNRDKHSWRTVLSEMTFLLNHSDPLVRENSIEMLRPVFLYILCNPSLDSTDYCAQPVWQLLIGLKHSIQLQTKILLWSCTTESYVCTNTNHRILEFAEKAIAEKDKKYCTALFPVIVYLTTELIRNDSESRYNLDILSVIIDQCDTSIGNLALTLMTEIIILCPPIYLQSILQICIMIINKMSCNNIFLNTLVASILKWMAYPSVLCSDALNMVQNLMKKVSNATNCTNNDNTLFLNKIFETFSHFDFYIRFYVEIVHCLNSWNSNDIVLWLKNMSRVPIDLKDKCKLLLSGLFLHTDDPQITTLSCNILVDISKTTKSFESHVLSLVLHKLTKSKNSIESKYLLFVISELVSMKENVTIVIHTLDTLLNGDKQLKYYAIELYLKTLRKEPRCYRFVSAAIIHLMKNDHSWFSNAICAKAMNYVCENHPEHGETLVPLLSQILNRSTDTNGGTASALALKSISALCKASVIDICSTWKVLAPKMEKEKRTIVLETLCELFSEIAAYHPSFQYAEEYDKLISDIITILWKYTVQNDTRIIKAALKALASYRIESISLKSLPEEFRCDLVLPAAYTKTSIDATTKPEDILPYIPGTCWIQMLQKINKMMLSVAGDLLISFITEEVNSFRSGIYVWPQGEPHNYKYLPEKSVIRAVGEYLRRCNKVDHNNYRIITECLRIFAYRYPKPLPNINWGFLNDIIDISTETKRYTLSILCRHALISSSAKSNIENYLLTYKGVADSDFILKINECSILYANLEDLCQSIQPSIMKPFLEITLEHIVEKMNVNDTHSIDMFHHIMLSYGQTLRNQKVHDGNSTLLSIILEKLLDKIDLTCDRFESYITAALELSTQHLERMTSPKIWWEVTPNKLKNAIAIRAALALKKRFEFPLSWLNEIIDETASVPSAQIYLLGIIQTVQTEMRFDKSITNWIIDFMTRIQGFLVEPSEKYCNKIQFYSTVLLISVISLSGIDCTLMKQDLLITSHIMQTELFPQALAILSNRQDWKHVIPQIMEWLNYMRTNTILPNIYNCAFQRALIYLRHNPYYKDVWTKYLSIKIEAEICL
ncbi:focadhesin isoform X2 [Calliopsis andreniformis]